MKKVTLLFCLSAGALLTASIALNLYLLSGRRSASSASSVRHEIPGQEHKKSAAKPQSKPLYWKRAEYDRYDKLLRIEFKNAGTFEPEIRRISESPGSPVHIGIPLRRNPAASGRISAGDTLFVPYSERKSPMKPEKAWRMTRQFKSQNPSLPPSIRFLTSGPYFPKKRKNTHYSLRHWSTFLRIRVSSEAGFTANNLSHWFRRISWRGKNLRRKSGKSDGMSSSPEKQRSELFLLISPR